VALPEVEVGNALARPLVRLAPSDPTPKRGSTFTLRSRLLACAKGTAVKNALNGTEVVLKRKEGNEWVEVARDRYDDRCRTSFKIEANFGTAEFNAFWAQQHPNYRAGRSGPAVIETHK
jgi:hypothetical protein